MKILGAVLELPAKQHCQSSPYTYLKIGPNWPNRQCCLAGSSKRAPRIFIFSIVLGAENLSYMKLIETHACSFFTVNISAIGMVHSDRRNLLKIWGTYNDENYLFWLSTLRSQVNGYTHAGFISVMEPSD